MRKLVLFDVDHTVVRGNLTGLVCQRLFSWRDMQQLFYFLYRSIPLIHGDFPREINKALMNEDYVLIDLIVKKYVTSSYNLLFDLLESSNISLSDLMCEAHLFLSDAMIIQKICYRSALDRILLYSQDPEIDILFISGGLQTVLDPFLEALQQYIKQQALCKARFFAYGTRFIAGSFLDLSVGSYKVDRIHEHRNYEGFGEGMPLGMSVVAAFSDNQYCSDLPLLLLAEESFLVGKSVSSASLLSDEIQKSLIFLPEWK
ncbi:hypothetical protein COB28_04520 [Candidatus Dependentiae bacterium]|nr:MAG: hypothetical protein COB28_04520 [Candidatus Dependentiae bacterium]